MSLLCSPLSALRLHFLLAASYIPPFPHFATIFARHATYTSFPLQHVASLPCSFDIKLPFRILYIDKALLVDAAIIKPLHFFILIFCSLCFMMITSLLSIPFSVRHVSYASPFPHFIQMYFLAQEVYYYTISITLRLTFARHASTLLFRSVSHSLHFVKTILLPLRISDVFSSLMFHILLPFQHSLHDFLARHAHIYRRFTFRIAFFCSPHADILSPFHSQKVLSLVRSSGLRTLGMRFTHINIICFCSHFARFQARHAHTSFLAFRIDACSILHTRRFRTSFIYSFFPLAIADIHRFRTFSILYFRHYYMLPFPHFQHWFLLPAMLHLLPPFLHLCRAIFDMPMLPLAPRQYGFR
jgi:hypothetical protein